MKIEFTGFSNKKIPLKPQIPGIKIRHKLGIEDHSGSNAISFLSSDQVSFARNYEPSAEEPDGFLLPERSTAILNRWLDSWLGEKQVYDHPDGALDISASGSKIIVQADLEAESPPIRVKGFTPLQVLVLNKSADEMAAFRDYPPAYILTPRIGLEGTTRFVLTQKICGEDNHREPPSEADLKVLSDALEQMESVPIPPMPRRVGFLPLPSDKPDTST